MPYTKIVTYYLNHSLLLTHITPFLEGKRGSVSQWLGTMTQKGRRCGFDAWLCYLQLKACGQVSKAL